MTRMSSFGHKLDEKSARHFAASVAPSLLEMDEKTFNIAKLCRPHLVVE